MSAVEDAEAALKAAHAAWTVAVELGEVQRMKDKHRALELAEAALERALWALERALWATDDEDEEVGEFGYWLDDPPDRDEPRDTRAERPRPDHHGYEPNNDPRDV